MDQQSPRGGPESGPTVIEGTVTRIGGTNQDGCGECAISGEL